MVIYKLTMVFTTSKLQKLSIFVSPTSLSKSHPSLGLRDDSHLFAAKKENSRR